MVWERECGVGGANPDGERCGSARWAAGPGAGRRESRKPTGSKEVLVSGITLRALEASDFEQWKPLFEGYNISPVPKAPDPAE